MHCVARQNKLETPKEKDEVNKREVHECDVWTRDPDVMVVPPTPKPTFKTEVLTRVPRPSTQVVKETLSWRSDIYHSSSPRGEIPNIDETTTTPKPHTHPSHPEPPRPSTPSSSLGFTSSSIVCLLWIDKVRAKDKTYIWVSVWWKTKN